MRDHAPGLLKSICPLQPTGSHDYSRLFDEKMNKIKNFFSRLNSVSTPFGGVGWDNSLKKDDGSKKEISFPHGYSTETVKQLVEHIYGEDVAFLVVQYGSSALDQPSNDEDYCVLVFTTEHTDTPIASKMGHSEMSWERRSTALDIAFREYTTFLLSLTIGRPYDVSVATDGKFIASHLVHSQYWEWAKALKDNILISSKDCFKSFPFRQRLKTVF